MFHSYNDIKQIFIEQSVISHSLDCLQERGDMGYEATVIWAGTFLNQEKFSIDVSLFPQQYPFRTEMGIGVVIHEDDIFEMNKWLYENKREMIAQVHTHPDIAYHSDTDDVSSLVTAVGQYSIVIPNFAKGHSHDISGWAIFRIGSSGEWLELSSKDISNIIEVT